MARNRRSLREVHQVIISTASVLPMALAFWIPIVVICGFQEPHRVLPRLVLPHQPCHPSNRRCHYSNYLQIHNNMDGAAMDDIQRVSAKLRVSDSPIKTTMGSSKPKGTMYITIGPQCAGKTTILRNLFGTSFHKNEEGMSELSSETAHMAGIDITIDDQALVYIPVPTSYFLRGSTSIAGTKDDGNTSYLPRNQLISRKI